MRIFLYPFVLLLFAGSLHGQLPCIRSNVGTITYSINGVATGNQWLISPQFKPDVMGFSGEGRKRNRVVFYTDVDSFACAVKPGQSVQFYILYGKDSALTEVKCFKMPPPNAHFSKKYIALNRGKSSFEIPEVQELVHIVMALTPTGQSNTNLVEHRGDYYKEVMAHFSPWKEHPAVAELEKGLAAQLYGHLKMDACGFYFKGNSLKKDPSYHRINWGSTNLIEPDVKLLEDFALKSGFRAFFQAHRAYYDRLLADAEKYMPIKAQWEWCEREFPDRYDHYRITFSPLVNGWHCTNRFESNGFKQTMMFICSAEGRADRYSEKVWEALMTRVVLTEIDHNYVNPISEKYLDEIRNIFNNRAFWANDTLALSYGDPFSLFNEYMTWAVFSLYALDHFDQATFDQVNPMVEEQMVKWRGFIHFKEFNRKLIAWYQQRPAGKKVADSYPEMLRWAAAEMAGK